MSDKSDKNDKNSCIAIFKTRQEAEQAIAVLDHAKFDMQKLAIVGKGYEQQENVLGYYNGLDRVKRWGKQGAIWGGLWGVLFSPAFMCVPVAGSFTAGAMLFSTVVGGVSTAFFTSGITAVGAALYSIGIPKNSIIHYESAIKLKKQLLIVRGTRAEVEQARDILDMTNNLEIAIHNS